MPEIKISRIVSVSSEDSLFKAENLLNSKKWRSQNSGEQQVSVVFQLCKSAQISGIDIGNNGAAFVEVQVAKQASPDDFKVILVASSFLTPIESRNENNLSRVRMFSAEKLNLDIAKDKWDLVKVVCTQPFNKSIKYGLSFISIHSVTEDKPIKKDDLKLGAFRLKAEDENEDFGSLFKAKIKNESVATTLRSKETLASIAVQSSEAERKRRKSNESENVPSAKREKKAQNTPKIEKRKAEKTPKIDKTPTVKTPKMEKTPKPEKTPKIEKKLPRRDVLDISEPSSSKKNVKRKEFKQFMSDVVFTISGFQNPLRGEIRQKALEMGAKYRGDWDGSCTHLICAFINTPKFNQVKGKGKIVTKDWIEKCHQDRKRYPWRRFCLDKNDKGEESEEEIHDIEKNPKKEAQVEYDQDTDEEIENLRKKEAPKKEAKVEYDQDTDEEIESLRKNEPPKKGAKIEYEQDTDEEIENIRKKEDLKVEYEQDTDEEIENIQKKDTKVEQIKIENGQNNGQDPYEADTDVDEDADLPVLPDFFTGKHFFLYGKFMEEIRKSIYRGIIAANGKVKDYMSQEVDFVITNSEVDQNFPDAVKINPKIQFLRPSYIEDCFSQRNLIQPQSKHLIHF